MLTMEELRLGNLEPPDLLYFFMMLVVCFQFTKKSRLRVPVMISISIVIIGQVIGAKHDLTFILGNICMVVAVFSHAIHKEGKLMLPMIVFNIIFLITQAVGYGFNIGFLKCYISPGNGSISLATIAISAIMAFLVNYIIAKYLERNTN